MRFRLEKTGDGSSTLFDTEVGESFKSRHAAATEVEAVFFRPAVRENIWLTKANPFRILELGLGLGTNFQHCIQVAREFPTLEFHTIERDLSGARQFLELGYAEEPLRQLVETSVFQAPGYFAQLHQGDFFEVLKQLEEKKERFHAIFFDPFSPKANPEAWDPKLFQFSASLLLPQGRLATYSVSRLAKDGCLMAGLRIEKRALPEILQKRNALLAIKAESVGN